MAEQRIDIVISGDDKLSQNVAESQSILDNITKAVEQWEKLSKTEKKDTAKNSETIQVLEKEIKAQENLAQSIKFVTLQQKGQNDSMASLLTQINKLRTANDSIKKTNKELAKDYENNNKQIEKNNEILVNNETQLKVLSKEYNQLQSQLTKQIQSKNTLNQLNERENLTLAEQKQLFAALNAQLNLVITEEGKASQETLELQQRMAKLNASIKQAEESTGQHQRSVGDYGKAIRTTQETLAGLIRKEIDLKNANKQGSQEYKDLQKEINKTRQDYERYVQQQSQVQKRTNDLIGQNNKLQLSFKDIFGAVTLAGLVTKGIGLIASEFKKGVETVLDFETALKNLQSILGVSDDELLIFRDNAIELSNKLGLSSKEIANSFALIGSQRPELLKSSDGLKQVTESAIILSQAGNIPLEAATYALTSAMNQLGLEASDTDNVINTLAATSQKGTGSIAFQSGVITKLGSAFKLANIDINEAISINEQLSKVFPSSELAATSLGSALTRLQAQGKGFESGQFSLQDALKEVQGELDNLGSEFERTEFLQKLFGDSGKTAGLTLLETKDIILDYKDSITGTNTAYEQAEINTNTFSKKLEQLKNTYDNLILTFATGQSEILDAGKNMLDYANALIIAMQESEGLRNIVSNLVAIFESIIEPIMKVGELFGEAGDSVSTFSTILEILSFTTQVAMFPMRLLLGIINALADAFVWIFKKGEDFKNQLVAIGKENEFVAYAIQEMTRFVENAIKPFRMLGDAIADFSRWLGLIPAKNEDIKKSQDELTDIIIEDNKKIIESEIKTQDFKVQKAKDTMKELFDLEQLRINTLGKGYEKELAILELNFKKQREQYKDNAEALLFIETAYQKEIEILNQKFAVTIDRKKLFENSQKIEKSNFDVLKSQREVSAQEEKEFQLQQLNDKIQFLKFQYGEEAEIEIALLQNNATILQNEISKISNEISSKTERDKIDNFVMKLFGISESQIDDFKVQLAKLYDVAVNFASAISEIRQSAIEQELSEIDVKRQKNDELISEDERRLAELQKNVDAQNGIEKQRTQNEINELNRKIESKKGYDLQLLQEEEKLQEELKRIKKREIFAQLLIDQASAIGSLIKYSNANPGNFLTGGIAGQIQLAIGLISIATNFAKAYSAINKLEKGGLLEGDSHANGGVPIFMSGRQKYEAEGGEYMVNKRSTKDYYNTIDSINKGLPREDIYKAFQNDFGETYNNHVIQKQIYIDKSKNVDLSELVKYNKRLVELIENDTKYVNIAQNKVMKITKNKTIITNY